MRRKNHTPKAFSLLELLVVIAILSILGAMAIISYHDYVIRSSIAALMQLAPGAKADVENAHNQGIVFGTSGSQTYVASSDSDKPFALDSVTRVSYGCIDIKINLNDLNLDNTQDITLALCPNANDPNYIDWNCGYESTTYSDYITYLPANCQNTVASIRDSTF